jgi:hypothetical protein
VDLSAYTPELRFAANVGDSFRARRPHGSTSLWLPNFHVYHFSNMVPKAYGGTALLNPAAASPASRHLFNYDFSTSMYTNRSRLDFFFYLRNNSGDPSKDVPEDLYVALLDIPRGAALSSYPDWFRRVRPFSFEVHDTILQRGGVTILNNVINPTVGEKTYVDYHLVTGGQVTIQVFTLDGTMVDVLYRGRREPGEYRAAWDGTNRSGRSVARGMYFIRVVGPDIDEIRKVMVVK